MSDERRCECGCETPMTDRRAEARYATDACRERAYRERKGEAAQSDRVTSQERSTPAVDLQRQEVAAKFWAGVARVRRSRRHRAALAERGAA